MKKWLLSSLKKAINGYLKLDPESRMKLQKLQGRIITIELLPFHFVFQLTFTEAGVTINADELLLSETKITGTPIQLVGVMLSKENRQRFFAEDLMMEGNAELGQQVVELFDSLQIDWQEYLSHVVGDAPAHHAGRLARKVNQWLRHIDDTMAQNINEYLHEETTWLPAREALNDFFNDIDNLRMDVDRLEIRMQHLVSMIDEKEKQ